MKKMTYSEAMNHFSSQEAETFGRFETDLLIQEDLQKRMFDGEGSCLRDSDGNEVDSLQTYREYLKGILLDKGIEVDVEALSETEVLSLLSKSNVRFHVDRNGNMTCQNAYLKGTFMGTGNISGGSININNKFRVDSNGNLTANSGTFHGTIYAGNLAGMPMGGAAAYHQRNVTSTAHSDMYFGVMRYEIPNDPHNERIVTIDPIYVDDIKAHSPGGNANKAIIEGSFGYSGNTWSTADSGQRPTMGIYSFNCARCGSAGTDDDYYSSGHAGGLVFRMKKNGGSATVTTSVRVRVIGTGTSTRVTYKAFPGKILVFTDQGGIRMSPM